MDQKMANATPEPWYSVEEIAEHLGISKETVYRWLDRRVIPAHRLGKLWKFKPTEVDGWVQSGGAAEISEEQKQKVLKGRGN